MDDLRRSAASRKYAIKLAAVVDHVLVNPVDTLVMIARRAGFVALSNMLQHAGARHGFVVAAIDDRKDFNREEKSTGSTDASIDRGHG